MTARRRRWLAQLALLVVGLLALAYPVTLGAHPSISCRGVVMRPGDSCAKADGSGVQTYEQRARALEAAKPVIAIVGLLVAGFGACLIVTERRRAEAGQLEEA